MGSKSDKYFMPYQRRWLADQSRIKIWEKSRRIGATYVQAYEDVEDCVAKRVPSVWFSSADETAAKEYIDYCVKWAKLFDVAARDLGEIVIDKESDLKARTVEFGNGTKIHGLSSNPKGFRSKGGKVILDEFAFHKTALEMWKAARPVITWGHPLRIISTHNGKQALYYRFLDQIKKGKLNWSHHETPLPLAVDEGLADRIMGRPLTQAERQAWLAQEEADCGDPTTWAQEYLCQAVDEATAFLTYDMIVKCERDDILIPPADLKDRISGDLYVGMDIARRKHLAVIWGIEKLGRRKITRFMDVLENQPFPLMRQALYARLSLPTFRRAGIDATGLGMQMAEEAAIKFGENRVEQVTFSNRVKEELAFTVYRDMEDVDVLIPDDHEVREDLHSIQRTTTAAGNIRFDQDANDKTKGHADRFWALALACHAAAGAKGPVNVASRGRAGRKRVNNLIGRLGRLVGGG